MSFVDPGQAPPSLTPDALSLGLAPDQGPGIPASLRQAGDIMQQRQTALAPARQEALQAASAPLPQPPQLQQPPKLTQKDAQEQDADQAWLTAAMFLGTLGGALTRRPLTNALAAFTGTVEGFKERNDADFKRNLEIWDRENKRVEEANSTALKQYETILKSRELSFEQKQFALQIKAAELDDDAMMHALQTGNPEVVAQLHDQRTNYGRSLSSSAAALKQEAQRTMAQQAAQQWIASPQGEQMAQAIAGGKIQMPSLNQRSPEVMYRTQALMARVIQINPDFNANTFNQARSQATAQGRVIGQAGSNIELVMRSAGPVIEQAAQAAAAVPATTFPRLNQLMQMVSSEIGDPNVRRFQIANLELAEMLARAMNPRSSVIAVSNMDRATHLISAGDSPDQYQKVLQQIKNFVERQNQAVQQAKAGTPMPDIALPELRPTATVPGALEQLGGQAKRAAEGATGPTAAPLGTPTSQIPGYSRGRGLPAGWNLTPAEPAGQ